MQPKQPNSFIKFSGMAFQMAAVIGLSAWLGKKLDLRYQTRKPWFTVGLSLAGIFASLYLILKDLMKSNGKK